MFDERRPGMHADGSVMDVVAIYEIADDLIQRVWVVR
jgi:hypothetical protein